ncbi:hypothetical protein GW17_00002513, partial [Ensete ventricosum]
REEEDLGFRGRNLFRVLISLDDREADMLSGGAMRKSFKDSLKVLEADIQHANTLYVLLFFFFFFFVFDCVLCELGFSIKYGGTESSVASDFPADYDGACLQMRMSYSPVAHLFLFLVQWADCSLAGALGLLRIMIYKVSGCLHCCNDV